ncbi:MAG: M23 family metallopeptidase [Candidatus Neomarinimicrobiota bacterium]
MRSEKYTLMLIPDNESESKSFQISRSLIKYILFTLSILIIIIVGYLGFYIPKISDYTNLKKKYDIFASERLSVLELSRKLERINQMDKLVRKSLGSTLNLDDTGSQTDSIFDGDLNYEKNISYIENIPSIPPIQGFVTQKLGEKGVFIRRGHHGIDIVAKEGEPILASASGVVIFSDWTYKYGNLIIIYHRDGYFTHYAHNKENFKVSLDQVERGEVIALVGNTGSSTGPHLHFEIWRDFIPVDPLDYLPGYTLKDLTLHNE